MLEQGEYGLTVEVLNDDNAWLQLRQCSAPDQGVLGYVYSHEIRCNGKIVAVIPYRWGKQGNLSVLARKEVTPCWGMDPVLSSLTGGCDMKDENDRQLTPAHVARVELQEEAGYERTIEDLIPLGSCFGTKSTDTVYHLFAVNVSGLTPGVARGDGSELETKASMQWVADGSVARDPVFAMLWCRLLTAIRLAESSGVNLAKFNVGK